MTASVDKYNNMDTTYGLAFLGLVCSAVLYGITVLQTYLYFRKYTQDSRWMKYLVGFLWFVDTLHLVIATIAIYTYLITNFANTEELGRSTWSMNLQTDCNGLVGMVVEIFFARRVWRLSKNYYLTSVIIILALIHFSFGVLFTVEAFIVVENRRFVGLIWVTSIGLGSAALADVMIAVSLCYYLLQSRTGFDRTDSLISTLIIYSLTTGLLTGILAFICVVCFAIMPANYVWLFFFWLNGKFYVNSFLAALNSREYLRERILENENVSLTGLNGTNVSAALQAVIPLSTRSSNPSNKESRVMSDPPSLAVNVQRSTTMKSDYL